MDGLYLVFVACCPPDAVSLCRYTATGERQHNGTAYHAASRHVLVFTPFCYCEKSSPQFNSKWFVPKKRASRFLKAFKKFLVLIPSIFRLDSSHSSGMPRSGQTPLRMTKSHVCPHAGVADPSGLYEVLRPTCHRNLIRRHRISTRAVW